MKAGSPRCHSEQDSFPYKLERLPPWGKRQKAALHAYNPKQIVQERGCPQPSAATVATKYRQIPRSETFYLGYLTQKEIKKALESASTPEEKTEAETRSERLKEVEAMGRFNHDLYLTFDHMDVYVATSMRRPLDFWNVSRFVENLFGSALLQDLHLRWFDPTQAYCKDRLDKGLVEGLMLKRAACTIYLAHLGKDSELATTLAQGKPVIAYVPHQRDFKTFCEYAKGTWQVDASAVASSWPCPCYRKPDPYCLVQHTHMHLPRPR